MSSSRLGSDSARMRPSVEIFTFRGKDQGWSFLSRLNLESSSATLYESRAIISPFQVTVYRLFCKHLPEKYAARRQELQDALLARIHQHHASLLLLALGPALEVRGKLPAEDGNISVSSLASFAVSATSAMSSLGVIDTSDTYSLSSVIRRALGLDLLVMRSPLIENMVLGAINRFKNNNFSLVSSYFNGTSIYAGKYINSDIFAGISLSLRSQDKNSGESGMYFLSDDLKLDLEISFDWDNPLGSFSLFSQVHELSVIGFLDNIGFTFTRRFSF